MNYWILALPREDMEHCISIGVFGLGRKQGIAQVVSGDKLACLVTREQEWKIIALGEALSDYYVDDKNVFKKDGSFIDRFDFKASKLKPEVSFKPFIKRMSFIKNPDFWAVYFRNSIVRLTAEDFQVLETAV